MGDGRHVLGNALGRANNAGLSCGVAARRNFFRHGMKIPIAPWTLKNFFVKVESVILVFSLYHRAVVKFYPCRVPSLTPFCAADQKKMAIFFPPACCRQTVFSGSTPQRLNPQGARVINLRVNLRVHVPIFLHCYSRRRTRVFQVCMHV